MSVTASGSVTRRVFKKGATDRPTAAELPELDARMQQLFKLAFPNDGADPERALAETVLTLMHLEKAYASAEGPKAEQQERWGAVKQALKSTEAFGSTFAGDVSSKNGGGLCATGAGASQVAVSVAGCAFTGDRATTTGGGLSVSGDGPASVRAADPPIASARGSGW